MSKSVISLLNIICISLLIFQKLKGQPVADDGIASSNVTLLSSNLDIGKKEAAQLDYGQELGGKRFPADAYNFLGRTGPQETSASPLSSQEKVQLQAEVDKCEINPANAQGDFVTVRNGKFQLQGQGFEFIGFNSYQVVGQLAYNNNQASVEKLFQLASQYGMRVTRFWLFSDKIHPSPLRWNEERFQVLDNLIEIARKYDIKIVFAFVNYWPEYLGADEYVQWSFGTLVGRTIQDFYTDDTVRLLYKAHVCKCINRVNSISGIRWRDDPAIMAWNLMNEPRCPGCISGGSRSAVTNDWMNEMSRFVKSIDPNHLVTTGMEGFSTRISDSHLDNPGKWALCEGIDFEEAHKLPNIDYATLHIYPQHKGWDYDQGVQCDVECQTLWARQGFESRIQVATNLLNKPLVLEEFGMSIIEGYNEIQRQNFFKALLSTMLSARERGENVGGIMFWMAIVDNYPDYDGYSIALDGTRQFRAPPEVSEFDLDSFRKQEDQKLCTDQNSDWVPNRLQPIPLSVTLSGTSVVEIIREATSQLQIRSSINTVPSIVPPPSNPVLPIDPLPSDPVPPVVAPASPSPSEPIVPPSEPPSFVVGIPFPGIPGSDTPATATGECTDIPPLGRTCQEQINFGLGCRSLLIISRGFCAKSCGTC